MAQPTGEGEQPEKVTGLALERALRRNVVAGCLGVTFFGFVSGIFLTSFGRDLGLSKFQFGLLGALPMVVFPLRLAGSVLVERLGHRKKFFTATFAVHRALWLLVIVVPFAVAPEYPLARAGVFLGLLLVSHGLLAMGGPAWLSWMGDLVPEERRGQFWAWRNALCSALPRLPILGISVLFDHMREAGMGWWPYVMIFGFGVLVGEIDLWIHYRIPEPRLQRVGGRPGLRRLLAEPLRARNFRRFLAYVGVTTASATFLGHFTNLYLLDVLDGRRFALPLGFATVQLGTMGFIAAIGTVNVALGLVLSRTWGYLIDRFGSKPVLRLLTLLLVPLPLGWLFITREHPYAVTVPLFLFAGVIYGAKHTLLTSLLYAVSPQANRTMFAAVYGVALGVFGAVSPILAGLVMARLGGFATTFAGLSVESFHVLCLITVGIRVVEQYLLGGFEEPRSTPTTTLVRRLVQANPFAVLPRAFSIMSSVPAERKATAARKLGQTGSQLATRELVELLDDPSPTVRKEAALALGHTRDEGAVEPLVERLTDMDAEMRRQAAWALGQIGSPHATERLIELLGDPYPHVRSAAALALGQVGGAEATEALMAMLEGEGELVEFASAATALGLLGHREAMEPILAQMCRTELPVLRRQLAVAVGDLLGPSHVFYTYLDQERKVHGRAATRSVRLVRRALRRCVGTGSVPPDLDQRLADVEAAYLAEDWPRCGPLLAHTARELATRGLLREEERGLAEAYLAWLGRSPQVAGGPAGLECCALGLFALEQMADRPPPGS
ncbi:MAG: MFS transporter [Candidatus Brocadiia bacterium]